MSSNHRRFPCGLLLAVGCALLACNVPLPSLLETVPVINILKVPQPKSEFGHPFLTQDGHTLRMDIVFPPQGSPPAPAVVLIHGGFWLFGDRGSMLDWATDLATQGYVAVSIDYRLIGQGGIYPTPVADILDAIAHIRSQAGQWNLDPERIAVFGVSAGAHLALEAGMPADASIFDPSWPTGESARVRAIVDLSGPTDFTADLSTAAPWQIALVTAFLGGSRDERPDVWREASPVTYARADGPAVLILHGDADPIVPIAQARSLNDALDAAGQPHEYIEIPGASHGWGSVWVSAEAQAYRSVILDFLEAHLQ